MINFIIFRKMTDTKIISKYGTLPAFYARMG